MNSGMQAARRALLEAFAELALSRRYREFGVGQIVAKAGVARSTFYYHFKAKDDLLLQNLQPMVSALAALPIAEAPTPELQHWVAHMWENRAHARRIFDEAAGRRLHDALSGELQVSLAARPADAAARRRVPLLAEQLSGSMLSLIRAWLAGRAPAAPSEIADALWSGARALAQPST